MTIIREFRTVMIMTKLNGSFDDLLLMLLHMNVVHIRVITWLRVGCVAIHLRECIGLSDNTLCCCFKNAVQFFSSLSWNGPDYEVDGVAELMPACEHAAHGFVSLWISP